MVEASDKTQIEQSVLEYLTSRDVRVATESLLNFGADELPPGVDWQDVPKFYSALRAATLIKIEYAITLERLWNSIWSDALRSSKFIEMSPDEQADHDEGSLLSVDDCFDEKRFIRCFQASRPKYYLYATVALTEAGCSIAFALRKGYLPKELVADLPGFARKKDGLWTDASNATVAAEVDVTILQELARTAVLACWKQIPAP
jgi:hypothetical protein